MSNNLKAKVEPDLNVGDVPQCFVIMPISTQNGYEEGHFQQVYEDIIKPSIMAAGLLAFRADETKNTNLIQLDILRSVIESPIAVCDMSSKNPNVFYELGMRQAFDLPTVLILDDETNAPFDVNGLRYVTYNKAMKHRQVKKAVEELTETIKVTYSKRDDKTEINSLIRLMDLANPAKLSQVEIPNEIRLEKLNELHLIEIQNSISKLSDSQTQVWAELRKLSQDYNRYNNVAHKIIGRFAENDDNLTFKSDVDDRTTSFDNARVYLSELAKKK